MDVDGDAGLPMQASRVADMVGIAVSKDDGADVGHGAAHRRELTFEVAVLARHPGIDDRDAPAVFDEVAVDEAVAESVQAVRELHQGLLGFRESGATGRGVAMSISVRVGFGCHGYGSKPSRLLSIAMPQHSQLRRPNADSFANVDARDRSCR